MSYTPKRGDIVWLQFNPHAGHGQAGRCPALVLSPQSYNANLGLMICCPITNQQKGYPFEVALPEDIGATGVVLADQVKSLDWKSRNAKFITELPREILDEVLAKLGTLLS